MLSEKVQEGATRGVTRDVWATRTRTRNNFAGVRTPCFIMDTARITAHVIALARTFFSPENVGLEFSSQLIKHMVLFKY